MIIVTGVKKQNGTTTGEIEDRIGEVSDEAKKYQTKLPLAKGIVRVLGRGAGTFKEDRVDACSRVLGH